MPWIAAAGLLLGLASPPAAATDPCATLERILGEQPLAPDATRQLAALGLIDPAPLAEALRLEREPARILALLEALHGVGAASADQAIRPHLFSSDPPLAAAATAALAASVRVRAVPTLERLLREDRSFDQTLAAIQALAAIGSPIGFRELQRFADHPGRDPILRAEAAEALGTVDPVRARKWVKGVQHQPGTSPFYLAALERLTRILLRPTLPARTALR